MATISGMVDGSRAVLAIGGAEARDFLQGLVTNDLRRLAPETAVYAALLSPQGKYLFDFLLVDDGERVLVDVARDRAAALMQRLALYRLRRPVTIAATELGVALLWSDPPGPAALAAPEGVRAVFDPRDPALGLRLYAADAAAALAGVPRGDAAARTALRVRLGVPETGLELLPEETYILEAGFERLHGVDFRKGCYVGQEVTARMKHRTELRKGLVRVAVTGPPPPPGTVVLGPDGRPAGTLHTVAGGEGLAHLRFDRAEGPLTAGPATLRRIG
jgi:hypothetical protein